MRNMTEEIWDYMDGCLSKEDMAAMATKIESDPVYRTHYEELLEIHQMMAHTDLEEPSMSFTRNVMEQVKLEIAPVALKTKIDKRIIYGLSGLFLLSILAVSAYAIASSSFSGFTFPSLTIELRTDLLTNSISLQAFLFVDVMLALIYLDKFLRQKRLRH